MTFAEIIAALDTVKKAYEGDIFVPTKSEIAKGGHFRVGNIVIKVTSITELE